MITNNHAILTIHVLFDTNHIINHVSFNVNNTFNIKCALFDINYQ